MTSADTPAPSAEISVVLPADSRFVATARVTTASLAAELDYSVDQIDELRVGVNELVALLVEWAEDHDLPRVELRFQISDDAVVIEGTAIDASGAPAGEASGAAAGEAGLDVLTRQILAGVVDEYEIDGGRGRIVKRRVTE